MSVLLIFSHVSSPSPDTRCTVFISPPSTPFGATLLATIQSHLCASACPGIGFKVFGLRRKPDHQRGRRGPASDRLASMSGFHQLQAGCAGFDFFIFCAAMSTGRQSATAAVMMAASTGKCFARRQHFHRRFNPVTFTPFGSSSCVGPLTRCVSARRRQCRGNGITLLAR